MTAPAPIHGRPTRRPSVRTLPTCHYCDMPAAVCEYDHFPLPQRHGGTETVPACINCHSLKDRVSGETWPQEQADRAFAELRQHQSAAGGGVIPAILFVEMWGLWDDQPHAVPQHWAELSPLARVLWARLLCLHLDGLEDGLDTSPAAVIATAAARTA
ncbi:hypothetical protein [Rhodococcus qingshengii]|uniref:hypothetical protein n=2 Tax=Rhodococcus TaxID=1827 RepID=UPI002AFEC949|nr:hypothetical protein [Rhodococcus qingshengii]MEA1798947.1 hypothetical protein [Rhodococcus qingshengii]